ncbi:MAG: hypothetical protein HN494_10100 [Opitutae bacterium]|nr:hypothetical protein [Opitutae bacterium]MBT6852093.1 hypothetical protein [Opitutae bacterium]
MKTSFHKTKFTALTAILFMLGGATSHAKTLGDTLRESKWDGLIGTWVDPETKGRNKKIAYAWKVKDHAILATSAALGTNSVAIMGRNAKDGTVFHVGADDKETSVLGKWDFKSDVAVLELGFVTGEGVEGVMKIRYTKKDDNTLVVSIEGLTPQPIVYTLVKVKTVTKAPGSDAKTSSDHK